MAYVVPADSSAARQFSITTDTGTFTFRTYWSGDITKRWLCDIIDANNELVLTGVVLATGINNLIQGAGVDSLEGWSLFVYDIDGTQNMTSESLGFSAKVYLVPPGEDFEFPYAVS